MPKEKEEILGPNGLKYATFSGRMLACLIDNILSAIVLVPIFNLFNKLIGVKKLNEVVANPINSFEDINPENFQAIFSNSGPSLIFQSVVIAIVVFIFWRYRSATPGKIFLRMKIVDAKTGLPPSSKQFLVRYLGYFVSILPVCLGVVWIYYDKRKQGFHDKMAGTVVVVEEKNTPVKQ